MSNLPNGMFIVGKKLMVKCGGCGRIVRVDKPFIGSLHVCLTEEERDNMDKNQKML